MEQKTTVSANQTFQNDIWINWACNNSKQRYKWSHIQTGATKLNRTVVMIMFKLLIFNWCINVYALLMYLRKLVFIYEVIITVGINIHALDIDYRDKENFFHQLGSNFSTKWNFHLAYVVDVICTMSTCYMYYELCYISTMN